MCCRVHNRPHATICRTNKIKALHFMANIFQHRSCHLFLYFGPLTWSFCGSPPPVAWCDLPWIQFFPACEPVPFADGRFDPPALPYQPLGSYPRPPLKDLTGSLVTALQHHCSHHGVHSRSLRHGGKMNCLKVFIERSLNKETLFILISQ